MELKGSKTNIHFHSGVLTIGGTIIEVSYGKARIFFDFGTEFVPSLKLPDESLQTLLAHRLVPELDHVYDPRLGYMEKTPANDMETAVFISHCHLDHTRMVNYLDPKIPLYVLEETKVLLNSLNANGTFLLPSADGSKTREMTGLPNEAIVHVGEISVELQRVDHDAYGACGLLIQTPDMRIAYTGDLRLHGTDREDTIRFCEKAKHADALIMEGVSISFDDHKEPGITSEAELIRKFTEIVKQYEGKQVTFQTYPGNVKRLAAIIANAPRQVVVEASYAYILKSCLGLETPYYSVTDPVEYALNEELQIAYETLLEDEHQYVWQVVQDFAKLKGGGVYIHSDATPLGDFDPAYQPFVNQFAEHDITFTRLGCSGHAVPKDLDEIVDRIAPKLLLPIHSLHPERLENNHGSRHLPTRGEKL